MRLLSYVATVFATFWATAWLFSGQQIVGPSIKPQPPNIELSYTDFVSVLLTVLGIILAALAIGIGIIAFRTMGEIKKEAGRIAEAHASTEVKRALKNVPELTSTSVEQHVKEYLPDAIESGLDDAIEKAGKAGRLDAALERAIAKLGSGGGQSNRELEQGFD